MTQSPAERAQAVFPAGSNGEFNLPPDLAIVIARGEGGHLRAGMRRVLRDRQIAAQVIGDGPLAQIVFSADPVRDYRSTKRGDAKKGRALMLGLFWRGIFLNPMGTKLYLSLAHDEAVCDDFLGRLDGALSEIG